MNELENLKIMTKQLQEIFNNNNWKINLSLCDSAEEGSSYIIYNDFVVSISIKSALSLEEKEKTLIHEIVHVIKRNSQQIATDNIKNEDVNLIWNREMEREQQLLANGIYYLIREMRNKK